jgi:ABC-type protease/lipase transport system fused ATPase/permease subunit
VGRRNAGQPIGYVPQTVDLIEGTVGQNIARFDPAATSEGVIAAARAQPARGDPGPSRWL